MEPIDVNALSDNELDDLFHGTHRELLQQAARAANSSPLPADPLVDPSDCRHGCNGDCVESGSECCNFTCHLQGDTDA